jgi:hypothetical protein
MRGNVTWSSHALSTAGTEKLYIGVPISTVSAASSSASRGARTVHASRWAGVVTTEAMSVVPAARTASHRDVQPSVMNGTGLAARSR